MTNPSLIEFIRKQLNRWLDWLDNLEQKSPRSQKQAWYRIEYHLPPSIVAVVSAILLYFSLFLGADLTLGQALVLTLFVAIMVSLFCVYMVRDHADLVKDGDAMALLAVIFFTTILLIKAVAFLSQKYYWLSPYATPIAIAPLLTALLLRQRLAMLLAFVVAILFGIVNDFSLPVTLVGAVGGVTIVAAGSQARTAHRVARAGLMAGFLQMLIVVFLAISLDWGHEYTAIAMVSSFLSGIVAAVFSLGVLPYLESFFSRVSNLRLLELADVNHPLLHRMSIEAPGTYHHSLIVASLAEDAANAVGANGLLCRVGAYFHDIGKMTKAEYFIENQGAFGNPHDQVSPSLSKLVITSHVKEGLALAKAYKLDKQVADFIPQHHGTSQIEFFYQKALQAEEKEEEGEKEPVMEETYRYPGPKPQSKEAGIVMLSDSIEAASRTLEEPNHQRYKDLVYKIINKKLFDGQLNETPLTLKDLHLLAERFTATLTSIHHARVPYPELENPKKKDDMPSFQ